MVKIAWKKNQIITVALTLLVVLGSGGLSYWIYTKYQETQEEEKSFQMKIASSKVKRDKVPSLEREVIKLRENLKEYVKILPDTKEVNGFVKKLSDFASQSGVEVASLKDAAQTRKSKTKEVFDKESFRIELSGKVFNFLKFISLIENYDRFITISEISLKAGEFDEDTLRSDVVHDYSMLVETFVYYGNEGLAAATNIQNYDKKRDMLLDEINSARNEIKVERYEYVYDPSVRDPFVDPRKWRSGQDESMGIALVEQESFISRSMDRIFEIKDLFGMVKNKAAIPLIRRLEIQKEVADGIVELNSQITLAVEEKWISDPACKHKLHKVILPEMELINSESRNFIQGTSAISMKELVFIRDELSRLYETGDFDGCIWRYGVIESQLGDLLANAAATDKKKGPVVNEIEEFSIKAKNAKEFQAISIKISGIISQPERSVLIVNGMVLSEGQSLGDDLIVERIEEKAAYFKFKGQVFKVDV